MKYNYDKIQYGWGPSREGNAEEVTLPYFIKLKQLTKVECDGVKLSDKEDYDLRVCDGRLIMRVAFWVRGERLEVTWRKLKRKQSVKERLDSLLSEELLTQLVRNMATITPSMRVSSTTPSSRQTTQSS